MNDRSQKMEDPAPVERKVPMNVYFQEQKLENVSLTDSCRDRQHLSNLN